MSDEDVVSIVAAIIYTARKGPGPKDIHPMADAIQQAERLVQLVSFYSKTGGFPGWAYESQEGGVK